VFLAGELYAPDDAVTAGLIDRVVAPEELAGAAGHLAKTLARSPGRAFAQTKTQLREATLARYQAARTRQREAFPRTGCSTRREGAHRGDARGDEGEEEVTRACAASW